MNTRKIERRARRFAKALVVGCASVALLGTLSGCTKHEPRSTNLKAELQNYAWTSSSLNTVSRDTFHDNFISDPDSDGPTSDIGEGTILANNQIDIAFHHGQIGANDKQSPFFSHYQFSKNIDVDDGSDESDAFANPEVNGSQSSRDEDIEMRYRIDNAKHTLTLYQTPKRKGITSDSIREIKYKDISERKDTNVFGLDARHVLKLKPISLRKYRDKHFVKIPYRIAEHHELTFYRHFKMRHATVAHKKARSHKQHRSTSLNSVG